MTKNRRQKLGHLLSVFFVISVISQSGQGADSVDSSVMVPSVETADQVEEKKMIPLIRQQLDVSKNIDVFIQAMLASARKEKDTVKMLCVDDKLTQIHALLKGVENRVKTLSIALDAGDSTAARHQFVILQVSFNKLNGLRVQADSCVGNGDIVVGASESETVVSEEITTEEATTPDQEIFTPDPVVRPSVASGFR